MAADKQDNGKHVPARAPAAKQYSDKADQPAREIGGPRGPEPTRYGDWERRGRCIDF